jgi:hypothetical protein
MIVTLVVGRIQAGFSMLLKYMNGKGGWFPPVYSKKIAREMCTILLYIPIWSGSLRPSQLGDTSD